MALRRKTSPTPKFLMGKFSYLPRLSIVPTHKNCHDRRLAKNHYGQEPTQMKHNKSLLTKALLFVLPTIISISIIAAPNTTNPPTNSVMSGVNPIQQQYTAKNAVPTGPTVNANGYVLMDANNGEVLDSKNANTRLQPASLTKMMSLFVISEALKSGRIHLTDLVPISKTAWHTGGSRMFVQAGTQVPVQDLIQGIIVASGNDAAVAMAEYVGGTQENFVNMMNQAAQQLGMKNSHFEDVNGLPAAGHYSSPMDLAILAQALINDFPTYYKDWYHQKWIDFNNIKQANRNHLLWRDPTVDGLKTGHTSEAGYCLVSSAQRNGMRLISVVMGAPSSKARTDDSLTLLNWGFNSYSTHQLYVAGQPLAEPRVWYGKTRNVALGLAQNLFVTIPRGQYKNLKAYMTVEPQLIAPVAQGKAYGKVEVLLNNQTIASEPLVALQTNPSGNLVERTIDKFILMFHEA
jgi:D-alanyl-D-alanine carboxypeptidase (penicillin-binding protein 5/6)